MGYSNGQVQSQADSGKGGKGEKGDPGLPGIGFKFTDDGDFDLDGKRLTDVAEPKDKTDAATKNYVDTKNIKQNTAINSKAEKTEVPLLNGSQSMKGNFNMENDDDHDDHAVNLQYCSEPSEAKTRWVNEHLTR